MRRPHRRAVHLAVALAAVLGVGSCSRGTLTAPEAEPARVEGAPAPVEDRAPAPVEDRAPAPPSLLSAPAGTVSSAPKVWYVLKTQLVEREVETVVAASRYQLTFPKGSLEKDEIVTLKEYDRDVLDVELGPHGTRFAKPVELSIDFSGTAADPRTGADGPEPVLYWLDEVANRWVEVPGTTDWKNMRHVVRLEHFSRYVVGGKAGWKHEPPPREEN